ncbi:Nucleotidyltransferase domain protein [Candidatus Magnetomorum sp. HK-1]|nr:Nucleotidyltransferase domain protein [Candidatus Magnetomorum sp. HK-1]
MNISDQQKNEIKRELISCLASEEEIIKIVIFGSFITSNTPNDIDVAIFQNSNDNYLNLAMKYRRKIRRLTRKIPIDIIPLKKNIRSSDFLSEILRGEVILEK